MFKKIHNLFHIPVWLFVLLLAVIIFRIPSFFEPYSYGDETIYLTLGQGIRNGLTLYKDLHDNKPPLLYITAAVAGNLFWFKGILLLTNLFGITLFYKFSEKLFPKIKYFPEISTVIFSVLTTLPFFEGNTVNAENLMIFPTLGAFYIILFKSRNYKNIFLAGLLFSISSLYKIPAIFDFPAVIFLWLISMKFTKKNVIKLCKDSTVLLLGIATPIMLTFIYYLLKGAFSEYLIAAYLQNFGYLSSWRPNSQKDPFLVKNAPLLIRGGLVITTNLFLFIIRKKVDKKYLLLVSWLSLSIFGITLSERPYPHYLLQATAPVSFLFALMFSSISLLQVYAVFPLAIFFLVPLFYGFWHYRSINYYTNFANLAVGNITKEKYIDSFGGRTKMNYEIAGIVDLLTKPSDKIFIWEDSAQIYALSKRLPPFKYITGYHINDFSSIESVISTLDEKPPKVIVIFHESNPQPPLSTFIKNNYLLYKDTKDYQIWKYGGEYCRFIIP
jgi:hypothetical protein